MENSKSSLTDNWKTTMKKIPLSTLLAALEPVVRPIMLQYCTPDCCIETSRALCRVFNHFGYNAHEVAVSVTVCNADFVRFLEERALGHDDVASTLMATAKCINIGAGEPLPKDHPGLDGHLVVRVDQMLVDASLQQADRPNHGIELENLIVFKPGRAFFRDSCCPAASIVANGCTVTYRHKFDSSYRQTPAWTARENLFSEITNRIVCETTDRLTKLGGEVAAPVFMRSAMALVVC